MARLEDRRSRTLPSRRTGRHSYSRRRRRRRSKSLGLWFLAMTLAAVAVLALVVGPRVASTARARPARPAEAAASKVASVKPKPIPASATDRSWMRRFTGRRVHRIVTAQNAVALTFDDGPTRLTKKTVQILDRYGAKGTFFVTGWCSDHPWAAVANRYTVSRGHELANHTAHHKSLLNDLPFCTSEIADLDRLLKTQTGSGTTWVRARGGGVDKVGLEATAQTGHLYAQWSVDSKDSKALHTEPSTICDNVVNNVQPGSIVLLHLEHPESIEALPEICRRLKERGYEMVTLTELAKTGTPYP